MMTDAATLPIPAAQRARHLLVVAGLLWSVAAYFYLSLPNGFPS